jgi:hypothetical protein
MPAPKKPAGGPDASKFKKGQSGNPGGRPKGAKGMKTLLAQELKESITVQQDGKKKAHSTLGSAHQTLGE